MVALRSKPKYAYFPATPDPSPEEIARLCAEIQASWDPETERIRNGQIGLTLLGKNTGLGGLRVRCHAAEPQARERPADGGDI